MTRITLISTDLKKGFEETEPRAITEQHNFAHFTSSPLGKEIIRHELLDCGWTEADQ